MRGLTLDRAALNVGRPWKPGSPGQRRSGQPWCGRSRTMSSGAAASSFPGVARKIGSDLSFPSRKTQEIGLIVCRQPPSHTTDRRGRQSFFPAIGGDLVPKPRLRRPPACRVEVLVVPFDDREHLRRQWLHAAARAPRPWHQSAGSPRRPETLQPAKQGRSARLEFDHGMADHRLGRPIRSAANAAQRSALAQMSGSTLSGSMDSPCRLAADWSHKPRLTSVASLIP